MYSISFLTAFIAVGQIFGMGAMGFYLVRAKFIDEKGLKLLSFLSINIFFPLFIFYQILTHFDPKHLIFWWCFPLINIGLILTGLILAFVVSIGQQGSLRNKFLAVSSFHNAGYIPLLMVMSLPLAGVAGQLYACVIISIIGFDICFWSLGVWLLTKDKSSRIDLTKMINPPLISMFLAISIVLLGGAPLLPEILLKPVKILGDAALGVTMLVIGGNLSLVRLRKLKWGRLALAMTLKLILLPVIALMGLHIFKPNPLIGFVLIVQACMPSSITLSIIGRNYNIENQDFINHTIFFSHVLSMISIPIFLGIYGKLFN